MDGVTLLASLIAVLIATSYANDKQLTNTSQEENSKGFRNPRVSSEFGYNIQNSDRASSHFRQEHRDVNGVVRGSYGFKNPNGAFRLVQYVADGKGFRAHISSNEQGLGRQNPASVSINRFEHQSVANGDRTDNKAPISALRKHNYRPVSHQYEVPLQRNSLYSPLLTRMNSRTDGNQNFEPLLLDDSDSSGYNKERKAFHPAVRQNPVDRLIRTRFGVPGEVIATFPKNERGDNQNSVWNSGLLSTVPSEHSFVKDGTNDDFFNPLYNTEVLPNYNYQDAEAYEENLRRPVSNYPQFLTNLLHRPQHKVHTSLPDCNSVSSAVLCKPPVFFRRGDSDQNASKSDDELSMDEMLRPSASHMFIPKEKSDFLDSSRSYKVYDLSTPRDMMLTPHLVPNSYPLRSDIYKNFFSHLNENGKHPKHDKDCHKHLHSSEYISGDYFAHSESQKYIKDAVSNDFPTHNMNGQDVPYRNFGENAPPHHSEDIKDREFYSSLLKIIQNDESLNKLKHLLLQTTRTSGDSASALKSPKLNLLGVLILPSHVVKELDQERKPEIKNDPVNLDEKNLSQFGDDIFESDIVDEKQQYFEETNDNLPEMNSNKKTNYNDDNFSEDTNITDSKTNRVQFDLPPHLLPVWNSPLQTPQYNINYTEVTPEMVKNSKFHILDDQELSDKDNNKSDDESGVNSNSTYENWRKILEEEISKELRATSMHQRAPSSETLSDTLKNPTTDNPSSTSQYNLNKHIGPLYDSTGKLIQPENVPIHIHRFNPPSGLASFPWKYSIPRPAPPRSIVVPPKPTIS